MLRVFVCTASATRGLSKSNFRRGEGGGETQNRPRAHRPMDVPDDRKAPRGLIHSEKQQEERGNRNLYARSGVLMMSKTPQRHH